MHIHAVSKYQIRSFYMYVCYSVAKAESRYKRKISELAIFFAEARSRTRSRRVGCVITPNEQTVPNSNYRTRFLVSAAHAETSRGAKENDALL
jgi:hypothetical protein